MRTNRLAVVAVVLLGLSAMMLAGCGSKVTKENFDKVEVGMTEAEVEGILGKATETSEASGSIGDLTGKGSIKVWKDGDKKITVTFANGKVALPPVATGL
jgi:hypothetical protein